MIQSIIRVFLFLIALVSPFSAQATGLGNLTLNSYLGQPFKAEIDIVSVKDEDIPSLVASLASRDAFRQANVDYAPFLFTFVISVENRANGQPYVKVTSPQRVVEPFLSMLIELNWSSGRLVREYTILLDPPEDALQPAPPIMEVEPVVPSSVKPEPATAEQPDSIIVEDVVISDEEPIVKAVPVLVPEAVPEKETDPAKKSSTTTYGPVKSGDTLIKIALKVAPPHVQLNQMLIAVHRANREAFTGNNINRLKAGPILRIPDANEIATISSDVADKEVKMQTANWEAYRQKLAANVASVASASEELAHTATGKISTKIENLAEAVKKPSKGDLNISKGEGLEGSQGENTTSGAQDKIRALEESATAKEKALDEANERVAMLEKIVEKLNQSLKLKNADMERLQQAEGILPDAVHPPEMIVEEPPEVDEAPSVESEESSPSVESEESSPTIEPEDAPSPKESSSTPQIKPAAPVPAVVVESPPMLDGVMESMGPIIDSMMENIEYVGAALLLLLIGIFAINRKKKASVDDDSDVEPPTISDPPPIDGPDIGTKQADEYDPVAEAGQYLDHGRYVQAEKILKDALVKDQSNPEILAKLLEVHALRKNKSAFETAARKLWTVSPTGILWERATKLGLSIDPENPFYGGSVASPSSSDQTNNTVPNEGLAHTEVSEEVSSVNFDLDKVPEYKPETSEIVNEPDFEIEFTSLGENVGGYESAVTGIGFPGASEPEEPATKFVPGLPEADLADINLNIDDTVPPTAPVDTQPVEKSAQWYEIATKIDLARAYQEMGDNDGAKEILQEVEKDGDSEQQKSARVILDSL